MLEQLEEVALAGSTTIVSAMATDAWQAARSGVARLFGHGNQDQEADVEAQLDSNAALVVGADDAEQARQALIPVWQMQLSQLLRQHPDTANDLHGLVEQIREALPQSQRDWAQKVQNVIVSGGQGFIVQDGSLNVYQGPPSQQRPLKPQRAEDVGGS